ncbi:MAG: GspH/FimT family pseudopilin [Armatimonadetes bacterium]|nr:GspH/FimT family pseudopilin [Armatimonadota bacterium]MDW8121010.1 GspH/FimT family pseudopilin [Armatimonadota bacterium]
MKGLQHTRLDKAFTLIELMVVMTILVLLAFVAVPQYRTQVAKTKFRSAIRDIVAVLRYARVKALTTGRPVLVQLDRQERTIGVLVPADRLLRQRQPFLFGSPEREELTDEEWWVLFGERLEILDPADYSEDPSPSGRRRLLSEGVEIEWLRDSVSGEELNLIAFYPDGTASGAQIALASLVGRALVIVSPLTGTVSTADFLDQRAEVRR